MAIDERDPHTGHKITGHEWNGIKELNTPVPKAVWFFVIVTHVFALVYWVLMPAWPLGLTYTKGLLGIDQRAIVSESLKEAALDRAALVDRIASADDATPTMASTSVHTGSTAPRAIRSRRSRWSTVCRRST